MQSYSRKIFIAIRKSLILLRITTTLHVVCTCNVILYGRRTTGSWNRYDVRIGYNCKCIFNLITYHLLKHQKYI